MLIDGITGHVIWRKIGDSARVGFTTSEMQSMEGQVLTHNHPMGWLYTPYDPRRNSPSFSAADIAILVHGQLAQLRATTPLSVFTVSPPTLSERTYPAGYYHRSIKHLTYDAVIIEAQKAFRIARSLHTSVPSHDYAHDAMIILAQAWGVHYKQEEATS